jgi:hypothetical protein
VCDVDAARIDRCSRGLWRANSHEWAAGDAAEGFLLHERISKAGSSVFKVDLMQDENAG